MRQLRVGLASLVLAGVASPALAQQGSLQVSTSGQTLTGSDTRLGTQPRVEPDIGLVWVQPGSSFGTLQLELRATRRDDLFHPGRTFAALRDVKRRGVTWTFEAGDTYFTPAVADYKFSNLFAPHVTLAGALVTARTPDSSVAVIGGRATAWRNVFGSDPDALGQTLAIVRATHKVNNHLEVNARGSRIRTTDLKEFGFAVAASDQGGAGMKWRLSPALQLVADAGVTSFRRAGRSDRERDLSGVLGASWLHSRGWLQVNASRFSPGDSPVLNNPLQDRETFFAAADYDAFRRLRLFAGAEAFRSNLDPDRSASSSRPARSGEGARAFGGFRIRLAARTTLTVRAEQGDRRTRPTLFRRRTESDTGTWGAEWQVTAGRLNTYLRYARRENVDRSAAFLADDGGNGASDASYTQHDSAGQIFVNVSRSTQAFGTASLVRVSTPATANTFVQLGGGAQVQILSRDLWLRAEGTVARNVDLVTNDFVPRESLSLGLNGRLTRLTTVGVNVNVDRTPLPTGVSGTPWTTRSMVRLTRTIPTGAPSLPSNGSSRLTPSRGTGTIAGTVFADWNRNGVEDPDENTVGGIPVRVIPAAATVTGRDGQFSFTNVPAGARQVGLDTSALPVDFDPPARPDIEVEVARGEARRVSFGLIPLGAIEGRVLRDANGSGSIDAADEPIDDAIVVLDGAARSEQVRKGRYRFDAVRSGEHSVKLLLESLPQGAAIAGNAEVTVALTREQMAKDVSFLVALEKRPEVRRVFPPKGGGKTAGDGTVNPGAVQRPTKAAAKTPQATTARARRASNKEPPPTPGSGRFVIQVAALANIDTARAIAEQLNAAGLRAFVLEPGVETRLYRIRVGPFRTRAVAERVAAKIGALRMEQPWIVRLAMK